MNSNQIRRFVRG